MDTNNLSSFESCGLFVDDIQKLRVLDPSNSTDSHQLKEQCSGFVEQIANFRNMTDGFIELSDKVQQRKVSKRLF